MYTEEDVENLAEFLQLAEHQFYWENGQQRTFISYPQLPKTQQEAWRALARVALEFKIK